MSLWTIAGYSLFLGNAMNITRSANEFFLVLWSLAVEEHFYIFWPFAVKFLQQRTLITLVTCVLLIEPILRAAFTPYIQGETIYYLTPFRLDSLAAGSLLALLTESVFAENWLRRWSITGIFSAVSLYALIRLIMPNFSRDQNSVSFNSIGYSLVTVICFFLSHGFFSFFSFRQVGSIAFCP